MKFHLDYFDKWGTEAADWVVSRARDASSVAGGGSSGETSGASDILKKFIVSPQYSHQSSGSTNEHRRRGLEDGVLDGLVIALHVEIETYAPQFRNQANRRLEILVATLRSRQHH
jgi:hypothetical protein